MMLPTDHEKKQAINYLVNDLAGSTHELQKQLNKIGFRLTVVRRGGIATYVIRGLKGNFKHIVKL